MFAFILAAAAAAQTPAPPPVKWNSPEFLKNLNEAREDKEDNSLKMGVLAWLQVASMQICPELDDAVSGEFEKKAHLSEDESEVFESLCVLYHFGRQDELKLWRDALSK